MSLSLLLVDDDEVDRRAIIRCLSASGLDANVREVVDGESAVALSRHARFDCVLLDYRLPDQLGTSLLRELSSSTSGAPLPVIMLTGQSDAQVAAEAILLGAQDYLTKDRITPGALRRSIVNAVEKCALTEQLRRQQEDLARANAELESKVEERTAELTEANVSLRSEIVERRRAQEALLESEQFLKGTLDALASHIAILDEDGTIVAVNKAWRAFGSSGVPAHVNVDPGANFLETAESAAADVGGGSLSGMAGGIRDVLSGRREAFYTEYLRRDADTSKWYAVRATAFRARQTRWTVVAHEDITARRKAETLAREHQARLAHAARINTMGEMASSLAHELNQPLTALDQYYEVAKLILEEESIRNTELDDTLKQAHTQTQRAGNIVRRLRDFAATGKLEKTQFDLAAAVVDSVEFTKHEARDKNIAVAIDQCSGPISVDADRIQIEQVLVNLLRNSIDAIELAGSQNRRIEISVVVPDKRSVRVCVSDTGPGIGDLAPEALFDPFKTSKAEGMGLGLSISRSILEAHGGRLWSERSSDMGATFCFALPIHDNGLESEAKALAGSGKTG